MNFKYFLNGTHWFDVISVWCMLIPILALVFTRNFRKSYGISLAISLISLFILALRDNGLLLTSQMPINAFLKNASLTLHSITAAFFMLHFTDSSRRKDQRLVLYMLLVGFILLFVMIGMRPVIYFIVNMACSLVFLIFGFSAARNLFDEFSASNHAVGGRLLMVISLLVARLGLLILYALSYVIDLEVTMFARSFETLSLLLALSLTIAIFRDAGYDPDNMEEDDGPYEALRIDPD
jgi:hypothetical protein